MSAEASTADVRRDRPSRSAARLVTHRRETLCTKALAAALALHERAGYDVYVDATAPLARRVGRRRRFHLNFYLVIVGVHARLKLHVGEANVQGGHRKLIGGVTRVNPDQRRVHHEARRGKVNLQNDHIADCRGPT